MNSQIYSTRSIWAFDCLLICNDIIIFVLLNGVMTCAEYLSKVHPWVYKLSPELERKKIFQAILIASKKKGNKSCHEHPDYIWHSTCRGNSTWHAYYRMNQIHKWCSNCHSNRRTCLPMLYIALQTSPTLSIASNSKPTSTAPIFSLPLQHWESKHMFKSLFGYI